MQEHFFQNNYFLNEVNIMKTTLFLKNIIATVLLGAALTLQAAEKPQINNATITKEKALQVILYASNDKNKIIKTLPPTTHFVTIYQKGDWIKVGNTEDGTVGWINKKQYQTAINTFNQPNIQQIFISKTVDKNNKPELKIVAYRNGKPVSEKEAKALYADMQKQEKLQEEYWKQFNQNMIHWQNIMLNNVFQDPFFNNPIMMPMPVIVVENNNAKQTSSAKKEK